MRSTPAHTAAAPYWLRLVMPCPLAYLPHTQIREWPRSLAAQRVWPGQPGVGHGQQGNHPLWGDRSRRMERKDFTNFYQKLLGVF